jgi:hypothetical protein
MKNPVAKFLLVVLALYSSCASASLAEKTCSKLAKAGKPSPSDERPYLCKLPAKVRRNIPDCYWWSPDQYRKWLQRFPAVPSATINLGTTAEESHKLANALVLDPKACRFFSLLSPSVQKGDVSTKDGRTFLVADPADFLAQCDQFAQAIAAKTKPACSVVEFAGHSTQSVGLDSIFGIDLQDGQLKDFPSQAGLEAIGKCLRSISVAKAPVFFSTCGGDRVATGKGGGKVHYWPGKKRAQEQLRKYFQLPIISGVGLVSGTDDGGVRCDQGWFQTP